MNWSMHSKRWMPASLPKSKGCGHQAAVAHSVIVCVAGSSPARTECGVKSSDTPDPHCDGRDFNPGTRERAAGHGNAVNFTHIWNWVDAHANLPSRARWKRESGCGSFWEQRSGYSVGPLRTEGFLLFESIIDAGTVEAFRETEYRAHGDKPLTLRVGETSSALAAALWTGADAVPQLILLR